VASPVPPCPAVILPEPPPPGNVLPEQTDTIFEILELSGVIDTYVFEVGLDPVVAVVPPIPPAPPSAP